MACLSCMCKGGDGKDWGSNDGNKKFAHCFCQMNFR